MYLCNKGYVVPKDKLTEQQHKKIINDLYVTPLNTYSPIPQESFKIYKESPNQYRLPKFYGIESLGIPSKSYYKPINIDIPFNGTLNTKTLQDIATTKTLAKLTQYNEFGGGGILSLPTGYGKTTCALYIASKLGVKTLIIVHKEFLMNQWIERIKQFLTTAKIGILRQDNVDVQYKDIVVGMLQSIAMKSYDQSIFSNFGLTIIDETHHICSKVFSRALLNVNTKYTLGLSATPDRKDGLSHVLYKFIGDICYSVERKQQKCVTVKNVISKVSHLFPDGMPMNVFDKVSNVEIISRLVENKERNELIKNECIKLVAEQRNVMILSERRNHCINLKEILDVHYGYEICGLYMGQMKQVELEQSEKKQIIIATYSLAHEGLDIPKLDSLILATSKGDVVQAVGRILRETPGKLHEPYVIDIVDNISPMMNQFRKRSTFYKKCGFSCEDSKQPAEHEELTKLEHYSFVED